MSYHNSQTKGGGGGGGNQLGININENNYPNYLKDLNFDY